MNVFPVRFVQGKLFRYTCDLYRIKYYHVSLMLSVTTYNQDTTTPPPLSVTTYLPLPYQKHHHNPHSQILTLFTHPHRTAQRLSTLSLGKSSLRAHPFDEVTRHNGRVRLVNLCVCVCFFVVLVLCPGR